MDFFELARIFEQQQTAGKLYLEFLRQPSLSMGLYTLEAGTSDTQQPHTEDEVYYVVSGQAFIKVGTEQQAVKAGSLVFVKAGVEHFFHTISEKLVILVFFAPAEYSQAG